jgi:hypothetical protein
MARLDTRIPIRRREGVAVRFHDDDLEIIASVAAHYNLSGPKFMAGLVGYLATYLVEGNVKDSKMAREGAAMPDDFLGTTAAGFGRLDPKSRSGLEKIVEKSFRRSMTVDESRTLWLAFEDGQRRNIQNIALTLHWSEAQVVLEGLDASVSLLLGIWPTKTVPPPNIIRLYEGFHAQGKLCLNKLSWEWASMVGRRFKRIKKEGH